MTDTNNFTACDMATAAADGFRDGVASVRPDHVEDVRAMVVPEGWKLVPVEPTEDMREAARDKMAAKGLSVSDWLICTTYAELLTAAPTPEPASPAQPANQYYFKKRHCPAKAASDSECVCWYSEGSGPFPAAVSGDDYGLTWRIAPEQPAKEVQS